MSSALLIFLVVLNAPREFSALELWERKCNAGDAAACERFERAQTGSGRLELLDKLARRFGARADRNELEENGMPRLDLAYKQALRDYIDAEHAAGNKELNYDGETVDYCAGHFHDYWRNRKMWWPTDENGGPSWTGIYYYIIDHYYGICLRRYFNRL